MAHIHAHLMALYAEDAKLHDEPWELWQHGDGSDWVNCVSHPGWSSDNKYRRKPRTRKIGEYEVPEPCKVALQRGQTYFVPNVSTAGATQRVWYDEPRDMHALESSLVHLDIRAAALHAKALAKVSKGWWT